MMQVLHQVSSDVIKCRKIIELDIIEIENPIKTQRIILKG